MRPRSSALLALLALISLLVTGCATMDYGRVEGAMRRGDYDAAAKAVGESEKDAGYGKTNRLLWMMDRAMTLHLDGRFADSAALLDKAHLYCDELYGMSLSGEGLALVANDNVKDYEGEDFERVMINVVGMLDYLLAGDPNAAQVEARRVDERLAGYAQRYGDKALYREDALARYLSALLWEQDGRLDDAYIDYKKCYTAFTQYGRLFATPLPPALPRDLIRCAKALGDEDGLAQWRKLWPGVEPAPLDRRQGEAVVLVFEGLAPVKEEYTVQVPVGPQFFSMAWPRFRPRPLPLVEGRLESEGAEAPLALYEDVSAIAVADLKARIARITVKSVARATAKFAASLKIQEEARKSGNPVAELAAFLGGNIYTLASERADLRSWRTLPGRIHLARLPLAPGSHRLRLSLDTVLGTRIVDLGPVDIKPGKKTFLRAVVH